MLRSSGLALVLLTTLSIAGCGFKTPEGFAHLDVIWGRRGLSDGRFQKPRAMAIKDDEIYVVDMTARIQVFTPDGKYLRSWTTPDHKFGRPTGLTVDDQDQVLVADTHYYRVLVYTREGKLLKILGQGKGNQPGHFGLVTDAVRDRQGNYYVSEYGEWDRIQKFSPEGKFIKQWGGHGSQPGEFMRPQNMQMDEQEHIWVVDACNHRIQAFDTEGKLLACWGHQGAGPGELAYPYDLTFDDDGNLLVVEYGNNRIQRFTRDGKSLGCWGQPGSGPGEMHNPWALIRDRRGRIHVLDTNNHRVQRLVM